MTDKERIEKMFAAIMPATENDGRWKPGGEMNSWSVDDCSITFYGGYSGFYGVLFFDEAGKLVDAGAWE